MAKKLLFITHQLTRTGAPQVLLDMMRCCLSMGHVAMVISLSDGEARTEWESEGVNVTIMPQLAEVGEQMAPIFSRFDTVIVNTLVCYGAIPICVEAGVNTIWWIHEYSAYFDHYHSVLPGCDELGDRITVLGVSPMVRQLLVERTRYISAGLLPFYVADGRRYGVDTLVQNDRGDRIRFVCAGMYAYIKGQDILCKAIEILPTEIRNRCLFSFYGNRDEVDARVYEPVAYGATSSSNVECIDAVPHDEMLSIIARADYLIIPSRIEAMPTVAVEGMMLGTPSILSDACGVTYYLTDNENALFFRSEDAQMLAERICEAVGTARTGRYTEIVTSARQVYEREFTDEVFAGRISRLI